MGKTLVFTEYSRVHARPWTGHGQGINFVAELKTSKKRRMGFKTVATERISFSTNKIEQKIDLDNLASDLSEKKKRAIARLIVDTYQVQ